MSLLKVVLSIVIPPVAVFLTAGVSTALIINIVLTLLGWLPGVIHALWILSKASENTQNQDTV
jgi:uncharacterized membrane protein YqaE (UPF0057 family)